jgi:hypothetical protein
MFSIRKHNKRTISLFIPDIVPADYDQYKSEHVMEMCKINNNHLNILLMVPKR